jgi:adenine-specific DNA-methyltransferase
VCEVDILRAFTDYMQQIPIPVATPEQKQALEALVEQILAAKQADPKADVQSLETEIDQIVYQLYDLSPVEIRLVEGDICVDNKGAECQR